MSSESAEATSDVTLSAVNALIVPDVDDMSGSKMTRFLLFSERP